MSTATRPFVLTAVLTFCILMGLSWLGTGALPGSSVGAAPLLAATVVPPPVAQDSWIDEENPTTPNGDDFQLIVGRVDRQVAAFNRQALVQFDFGTAGLPPAAQIISATLELTLFRSDGARLYNIRPDFIQEPWDEPTVTWDTQPPAVNVGDPPMPIDTTPGPKTWDVFDIVVSWASGNANNGILLVGDNETLGLRAFYSRTGQVAPPPDY